MFSQLLIPRSQYMLYSNSILKTSQKSQVNNTIKCYNARGRLAMVERNKDDGPICYIL